MFASSWSYAPTICTLSWVKRIGIVLTFSSSSNQQWFYCLTSSQEGRRIEMIRKQMGIRIKVKLRVEGWVLLKLLKEKDFPTLSPPPWSHLAYPTQHCFLPTPVYHRSAELLLRSKIPKVPPTNHRRGSQNISHFYYFHLPGFLHTFCLLTVRFGVVSRFS